MDPITDLTITMSHPDKSATDKLKLACTVACQSISGANRTSIWRLVDNKQKIECLMCFDQLSNSFSSGQILTKEDFPEYFEAILENEHIVASDARNHPSTECFNADYFIPNDIYSLLDYILHQDFSPTGIFCCESVGTFSHWEEQDSTKLRKMANIISMFFTPDL
ncbi:histidine kinase [Paraglaciecola sp. 2405UD69-4]|uniref:histidine kinase n=1 Tax=Paraglaciecola sp. 2405UD69-4 TaxID=3391836 RepID=UPI0039C99760